MQEKPVRRMMIASQPLGVPLGMPGRSRSSGAIAQLRNRIAELEKVIGLLSFNGAFVAGGSVVRAFLANSPTGYGPCDLDLFVVGLDNYKRVIDLMEQSDLIDSDEVEESSGGGRSKFWGYEGIGSVDVVLASGTSADETIARFDFRCAAIATDGRALRYVSGAISDLRHRRLFPLRPTRADRVAHYLAFGLDIADLAPPINVDKIEPGIEGWTVAEDATWHTKMGLDGRIEILCPPIGIR